ncbi:MAG: response regulator [Chromatiales bacterium]|nr:response regulator [Gammaproteobacteria bacterium]MBW6476149.1 response regulator [Chromatiales bacterium]
MLTTLHQRLRHSLKFRIAGIIFLLEAIMLAVVLGVTLQISQAETAKQLEANQQVIHQLLSNLSRVALLTSEYDELQPYIEEVVRNPQVNLILLADRRGHVVVSNQHEYIGAPLPQFSNTETLRWMSHEISNISGKVGELAIRFSHAQLHDTSRRVRNLGIIIALTGMTLIAFVGILIGHLLTRRLGILASTAEKIAAGDIDARTGITGNDEVAIVGQAFDSMAEQISDDVEALRRSAELLEQRVENRTRQLADARDQAIAANRSKSAFLANMSHEIRTPLTAIIGFSESLLHTKQSIPERIDAIRTIIRSGNHLLNIISDILDVSKIEADRLEVESIDVSPFELLDDIQSIISLLAADKKLSFDVDLQFPLPKTFKSDPLRVKQILINLCNNAIKFTHQGSVTVRLDYDQRAHCLAYTVCDTGIGMRPDQLENLFQAFNQVDVSTTRKFGGTGLGLYLSRQLAERLGGTLTVESTPGVGSCFTLSLICHPLDDDNLVYSRPDYTVHLAQESSEDLQLHGKVLLAEDNPDNQKLISLLLKRIGVEVSIADNGKLAVNMAESDSYDLVFMDIQMPVMSGIDAVRQLRANGYRGTIIALTANATADDARECQQAGFDDFMSKPIDREKLAQVLAQHLRSAQGSSQARAPLISTLLERDSSLMDLVLEFVAGLHKVASEIRQQHNQSDLTALKFSIHSLKGSSGNFGYMELHQLCQSIEFEIAKANQAGITKLLDEMDLLISQIEAGVQHV